MGIKRVTGSAVGGTAADSSAGIESLAKIQMARRARTGEIMGPAQE